MLNNRTGYSLFLCFRCSIACEEVSLQKYFEKENTLEWLKGGQQEYKDPFFYQISIFYVLSLSLSSSFWRLRAFAVNLKKSLKQISCLNKSLLLK